MILYKVKNNHNRLIKTYKYKFGVLSSVWCVKGSAVPIHGLNDTVQQVNKE